MWTECDSGGAVMQGLILWKKTHISRALMPASSVFGCVIFGGSQTSELRGGHKYFVGGQAWKEY